MRKNAKSFLSFVLMLAVLCSVSLPAFADGEAAADAGKIVVAGIGDSISNGCSLYSDRGSFSVPCAMPQMDLYLIDSDNADIEGHNWIQTITPGTLPEHLYPLCLPLQAGETMESAKRILQERQLYAFPTQVALSLNNTAIEDVASAEGDIFKAFYDATDYRSLTADGMTSRDFRYALDFDYMTDKDESFVKDGMYDWAGKNVHQVITQDYVNKQLEGVDVLLYELGSNDVLSSLLYNVLSDESLMSDIPRLLSTLVEKAAEYRDTFSENTSYIVNYFLKRNPNATVVLVGCYNFFQENDLSRYSRRLSEDSTQLLMNALTLETARINSSLRDLAEEAENIIYVDTAGTQTGTTVYDESGNVLSISGDEIHPSIEGHSYIARRILSALPSEIGSDQKYDIHIDLFGTCEKNDKITAVFVNDILYTDYDRDGYALTIHARTPLVTSVTVYTKGEQIGVNDWQCSWNSSDGYRTYSHWKVSDLKKTILLPYTNIKDDFRNMFGQIRPLFFR